MEKLFTNRNRKKAVLITEGDLLTRGIIEILEKFEYKTTPKHFENIEKRDYKARLIVIVSYKISEKEMKLFKDIRNNSIYAKVLLVTGEEKEKISKSILKIGLDGIVSAFDSEDNFYEAIKTIEKDKYFISPFFIKNEDINEEKLNRLTKRQYQIYLLNKEGKTQAEIAQALNIMPKTVSNHISKIKNLLT